MTELLEKALATVRGKPAAEQDSIAQAMLSLVRIGELADMEDIAPEHLAGVLEGMAQAARGEFASDEEVAEVLRSFEP